jgi:hypothetical protein
MFAYVVGILPSLAYTSAMEWAYRGALIPGSIKAITVSTALGAFFGWALGNGFGPVLTTVIGLPKRPSSLPDSHLLFHIDAWAMWIALLGAAVGLLIGILTKLITPRTTA